MHSSTTLLANKRIEIADVLRGFAVLGITIIHFIERFSLYSFPEETSSFLLFTDRIIWDSVFFTVSGKAYCIFALLFGFSFYIQDNSQKERGHDFRGRFAWRLLLLAVFAVINSTLFPGEILVLYVILGYVLIAVARLSSKTIAILAVVLLLQPIEWYQLINAFINPEYTFNAELDVPFWDIVNVAQKEGTFWEMSKTAIWTGNIANMGWMLLHGRVTQTVALFMIGMLIGRSKLFLYTEKNINTWIKVFIISVFAFFPLYGMIEVLPDFLSRDAILVPLTLIFKSLSNIAFTGILFAGIILIYYLTKIGDMLHKLAPYGRLSLTNYLSQSLIGTFLFYNWGLGLYRHTGITVCFLIGIAVFIAQLYFSNWWLKTHTRGPLEELWKRLTWIDVKKR